jgi:integrase
VFPITERRINYIVKATAKRAGINPATSPHWLRHAHASHAIDEGAPITLVSQTLGHAELKTTSVYAHAKPNDSSVAISRGGDQGRAQGRRIMRPWAGRVPRSCWCP